MAQSEASTLEANELFIFKRSLLSLRTHTDVITYLFRLQEKGHYLREWKRMVGGEERQREASTCNTISVVLWWIPYKLRPLLSSLFFCLLISPWPKLKITFLCVCALTNGFFPPMTYSYALMQSINYWSGPIIASYPWRDHILRTEGQGPAAELSVWAPLSVLSGWWMDNRRGVWTFGTLCVCLYEQYKILK